MSTDTRQTPSGRRLVVSQYVAADRETVWELLTDTERWPDWGPTVADIESDNRYIQAGTTGQVKLPIGIWLPFEVTSCGGYRWSWDVARIPATGHRIERAGDGCRVGFELPLYAAGYALVCRRALDRIEELATAP